MCVCYPGYIVDIFNPLHCEGKLDFKKLKYFPYFLIDINECLSSHNCTGHNEVCENIVGSYRCICASGYRRDNNGNCISKYILNNSSNNYPNFLKSIDINECAESTTACDVNSRCEDRNGSYACCMNSITSECIGKILQRKMNQ